MPGRRPRCGAPGRRSARGSACRRSGRRCSSGFLPARLRDARQLAQEGSLPEADPAQGEAAHVGARAPAYETAAVAANLELRLATRLGDERLLGHRSPPPLRGEGHAEELKKFLALLVGLRRRHDADLQPAETVDLVVIDLGERELLA